jgi:hypothetical protein
MRKIVISLLFFISFIGYSQTNGITYQALILNPAGEQLPGINNSNAPLANKNICLKFYIIDQNSAVEYVELTRTTTDEFGMVNLIIGTGDQMGGYASSFSNIVWNANPKRLKVELSASGTCFTFVEISNQPFTAVPFALYAVNSESTAALAALQTTVTANAAATTAALALKENTANKSITTTLGTSNVLFPTQNAVKTYVDTNITSVNANTTALQATVTANAAATTTALASKENTANKSTTTTLGTSDVLFPTQNAVKTYVDTNITSVNTNTTALQATVTTNAAATTTALATKEDASNKSNAALGTSSTLFPTQNAVKTYVDNNITTVNANTTALQATVTSNAAATTTALATKEDASNKSNAALGTSTTLFPTQNAVKTYVDAQVASATIADANTTTKGKIQLAGDLGGTASSPTVPGLALKANASDVTTSLATKEDASNKSNAALGTSTTLFPTQNAVKTYVDAQVASATIADADASTKGKIQLSGDLGGTAASPTVPGLALKAPIASPTFTGTVTSPIYASAPQTLTDAATISWNPSNGLNASVTLGGNRTLNFTTTPAVGSYGTLVISQDATGGRTITLPSTANKVLGSASTTTIALSSAANAKDILNFYYDGTNCYWNIGQGYGTAEAPFVTNLASGVSGILPVASGGSGAATLTGYVKGNGTTAMTATATIPLADVTGAAPIASPTFTGTPAAPTASAGTNTTQIATTEFVTGAIATATIPDATTSAKGKIKLAGDLGGTADAPTVPGLALKANTSDVTTFLAAKEDASNKSNAALGTSSTLFPTQNAVKTYVDNQIASATIVDADASTKGKLQLAGDLGGTAAAPTVPGLALKAPIASPTFTGTVTSPIYASAPQALTDAATISWNPSNGLNASVTLGGNRTLNFTTTPAVGSYGTLVISQDATGGRTITLPSTSNKVLGSASTTTVALSSAANAKDILNFYYDGSNCYWNVGQGYGTAAPAEVTNLTSNVSGTLAVANGGTGATTLTGIVKGNGTTALTAAVAGTDYQAPLTLTTTGSGAATLSGTTLNIPTTTNYSLPTASASALGGVKVGTNLSIDGSGVLSTSASPNFTGSVTSPIFASTPQALTDAATISWNPSNGLNASVTLGGNRTLSFTATPTVGSYGTLVITQDATGGRTITLPSTANKVLGSTSTTTVTLSSAAGAKDILNFYYDGTNCYWNVGQGYGTAATVASTNLASSVSGTLAVANGGTGATTLTANNVLLGNGTSALQVVAPGASGNVLTSNGTTWSSAAPAASGVPYTGATGAVNLGSYELTANGVTVGRGASSRSNNYAYGYAVLSSNTTGNFNNAFGHQVLTANTTGQQNSAFGEYVLPKNIAGNFNTAMGTGALRENTSGSGNTGFGQQALSTNSSGSNNTAIGNQANVSVDGLSNTTAIGNGATVSTSNTIQLGNSAVTDLKTDAKITTGAVTYPNTHGTANQVLTTTGSGTLTWTTPAAVRLNSDEISATAAQTSFTLSQTPLGAKVWMFVNGVRIRNGAYSISGTTVTYTAANNNSYAIVAGDRIQFDYAY